MKYDLARTFSSVSGFVEGLQGNYKFVATAKFEKITNQSHVHGHNVLEQRACSCCWQEGAFQFPVIMKTLALKLFVTLLLTASVGARTPSIDSLTLVSASTQQSLGEIVNGTNVNLAVTGSNICIQAHVSACGRRVASVSFAVNSTEQFTIETSKKSFKLFGDQDQFRSSNVTALSNPGWQTITVTIQCRALGSRLTKKESYSVTIKVVKEVAPTFSPNGPPPRPIASPPATKVPSPTAVVTKKSKCGGAVNTGRDGTAPNKCNSDLWKPTGDRSIHCYAYGGANDPCALHNNNDVNDGLFKSPAGCDRDTFYLWDEVSS
jgi:hypothetical protein